MSWLRNITIDQLTTFVYRKKTHTDKYNHFTFAHHPRVKHGVINCIAKRVQKSASNDKLGKEKNHIEEAFKKNGYLEFTVQQHIRRAFTLRRKVKEDREEMSRKKVHPFASYLT
jgi:hypothetical protein